MTGSGRQHGYAGHRLGIGAIGPLIGGMVGYPGPTSVTATMSMTTIVPVPAARTTIPVLPVPTEPRCAAPHLRAASAVVTWQPVHRNAVSHRETQV